MRLLWVAVVGVGTVVFANCANSQQVMDCGAQTLCGSICVDVQKDSENCGVCGNACSGIQACSSGKCVTQCPSSGSVCAGTCVNLKSDNANCGMCGKACKTSETCIGGGCISGCAGKTICGLDAGAPYCADLKSDNANCGSCSHACNATEACVGGTCNGSCSPDQTLCGVDAGKPYCATVMSDNTNCGDCGVQCGALAFCNNGTCIPGCSPMQKMCNPDGGMPYCVDILSDNNNCGDCGIVCPPNKPVCAGGSCTDGKLYMFSGVQNNLSKAILTGWSICYQDTYDKVFGFTTAINNCKGQYLLMACSQNNAASLAVAAMGLRTDVTFMTGNTMSGQNKVHISNGVEWYCDNNWAWGFANANDAVSLNECDTDTNPNNNLRLCWHTLNFVGGYRCGSNTGLNSDPNWTRYVYTSP